MACDGRGGPLSALDEVALDAGLARAWPWWRIREVLAALQLLDEWMDFEMPVRPGAWHVRSLRMPHEEAEAVVEAARRMGVSQTEFIRQAVRYVCREAGIEIGEPDTSPADDPFE